MPGAQLSHPEPGFFVVGIKSYGRAPTFLMATGFEQVRSIAAGIAGDWSAARQVKLVLPESGACGAPPPIEVSGNAKQAACCEERE